MRSNDIRRSPQSLLQKLNSTTAAEEKQRRYWSTPVGHQREIMEAPEMTPPQYELDIDEGETKKIRSSHHQQLVHTDENYGRMYLANEGGPSATSHSQMQFPTFIIQNRTMLSANACNQQMENTKEQPTEPEIWMKVYNRISSFFSSRLNCAFAAFAVATAGYATREIYLRRSRVTSLERSLRQSLLFRLLNMMENLNSSVTR